MDARTRLQFLNAYAGNNDDGFGEKAKKKAYSSGADVALIGVGLVAVVWLAGKFGRQAAEGASWTFW